MVRVTNPATPTRTSSTLSSVEENSGDGVLALSCHVDQDVETHVILDQTSAVFLAAVIKEHRAPSAYIGIPFLHWHLYCIGHTSAVLWFTVGHWSLVL